MAPSALFIPWGDLRVCALWLNVELSAGPTEMLKVLGPAELQLRSMEPDCSPAERDVVPVCMSPRWVCN